MSDVVHTSLSKFLSLNEEDWYAYAEYLDGIDPNEELSYSASTYPGAMGIHSDVLARAVHIALTFRKTCQALHAQMRGDAGLLRELLRPLSQLPLTSARALTEPFSMQFLRADYFLTASGKLRLIEVNSCGGGASDLFRFVGHLRRHFPFSVPEGCAELTMDILLTNIAESIKRDCPSAKTIGFAAIENGCDNYLHDCREFAAWFHENSDLEPVLLSLTKGKLAILDDEYVPAPISHLKDLDSVYCDWFEDLACLERVEQQLRDEGIVTFPARSDILFENKNIPSMLQRIGRSYAITEEEWEEMQDALMPSFPASELDDFVDQVNLWPGFVLKQDIDCASENVFIYDFEKIPCDDALKEVREKISGNNFTWTIQCLTQPPIFPLTEESPEWIEYDMTPYKYDLMVYICMYDNTPYVLYGARGFSREKVDELSEEGREDGVFGPVFPISD